MQKNNLTDIHIDENGFNKSISGVFDTFLESTSNLAFVKDREFKYVNCSATFASLIGRSKTDIIGKTDYDLLDQEIADSYRRDDEALFASNQSIIDKEEIIPSTDGRVHYSLTSKYIIKDEHGNIIGLYGTGRDITQYRAFAAKTMLVNESATAVFVIDADNYELLYTNDKAEEMSKKGNPSGSDSKKCYSYIYGLDHPCANCTMSKASEKEYNEKEIESAVTGNKYVVREKIIQWADKRAYLEYVYEDTDRINLRIQLEANQRAVTLAGVNGNISFWNYNLDTKVLIWDDCEATRKMGYSRMLQNVPDYFLEENCIHPDDVHVFEKMYQELFNDAEVCESTIRIMNLVTGAYEWKHLIYTRLHDESYSDRMAIGFAESVDMQKELESRFLYEEILRHELIRNSDRYYEMNLTTGMIVEHWAADTGTQLSVDQHVKIDEFLTKAILTVMERDREIAEGVLLQENLLKRYHNGESRVNAEYRRKLPNGNYEWMACTTNMLLKPNTNEIIAFINVVNIDRVKKHQLVQKSIMDEEVDAISLVNIASNTFYVVKNNANLTNLCEGTIVDYEEVAIKKLCTNLEKKEQERFVEFFAIDHMRNDLQNNNRSTFLFEISIEGAEKQYYRSTIFYLDETCSDIVIARRNITKDYLNDIAQRECLKQALEEAEKAGSAKQDFLARMSHDIRTPLNAIIGLNRLIKDENDLERIREYNEKIDISGQYLLNIVNDVLDLGRFEEGKIELHEEVYSLKEFEDSITILINPMMEQKDITFVGDLTEAIPYIMVDKLRYNQIIINLLTNACKYTPSGGLVEFSVQRLPDRDGKVGIRHTVRDNGIGMSDEFLQILFKPFEREKSKHASEQQGSGLGLAIVKRLVDAMGGSISVSSKLGEGTEFVVELYVYEAQRGDVLYDNSEREDVSLEGLKILLVEDNEINAMIAETLLQKKGCIVTVVNNGLEAVETFEKSVSVGFDIILMDIRMPVMNGFEATEKIRSLKREDAKKIPIIAMTADVFAENATEIRSVGMNAHVIKPFNPPVLYQKIAEQVSKSRL